MHWRELLNQDKETYLNPYSQTSNRRYAGNPIQILCSELRNLKNYQLNPYLAIYNSKEVFESDRGDKPGSQPGIEVGVVEKIGNDTYKGSFEIPPGTYAIGVDIDENENMKLDTNFLGIPKEQYGFSNNTKAFGTPKFEAASFVIDTYKKVQIDL